jgi:hypothetical protein
MVEWPGRCYSCGQEITDWNDAGLSEGRWIHKACYSVRLAEAQSEGVTLEDLRSPAERQRQLELPMLFFLLLFHFGLGAAVAGWIMIDQDQSHTIGAILIAIGIITPLIGIGGVAVNIISRRRIELIRQELDTAGGWRPGR